MGCNQIIFTDKGNKEYVNTKKWLVQTGQPLFSISVYYLYIANSMSLADLSASFSQALAVSRFFFTASALP